MSECTHDCSTCGENCSSRTESFKEPQNKHSDIKKVIGIVSGKGGVGKSSQWEQRYSTHLSLLNNKDISFSFLSLFHKKFVKCPYKENYAGTAKADNAYRLKKCNTCYTTDYYAYKRNKQ